MPARLLHLVGKLFLLGTGALIFSACSTQRDTHNKMVVSVRDQRMLLLYDGKPVKLYPVSTSKFGLGDRPGSNRTPVGRMEVAHKIGGNMPAGAVLRNRRPTGEVVRANAPGRDAIVSRIIWLRGTERSTRHAFGRYIYIHGTPEEWRIGQPASYGCIRMKSSDVIDLYRRLGVGAEIRVVSGSLYTTAEGQLYLAVTQGNRPSDA